MTDENSLDARAKYFQEYKDSVLQHLDSAFAYEKEAIAYSKDAIKTMTYLCGGALVALPATVSFFDTKIVSVKFYIFTSAACFVFALILIALANGCAFFTMARRSEGQMLLSSAQSIATFLRFFPQNLEKGLTVEKEQEHRQAYTTKINDSNFWRFGGLISFWASLALFIAGCTVGGIGILR